MVWLATVGAIRVLREPRNPHPSAETMDLGPEPPAVANLLLSSRREAAGSASQGPANCVGLTEADKLRLFDVGDPKNGRTAFLALVRYFGFLAPSFAGDFTGTSAAGLFTGTSLTPGGNFLPVYPSRNPTGCRRLSPICLLTLHLHFQEF